MLNARLALVVAALLVAACQPQAGAASDADGDSRTEVAAPGPEIPPPVMPADAPPQEEPDPQASIPEGPDMAPVRIPANETPCRVERGPAAAARLAERCRAVSPATRPPCHVDNPCGLIQSEIDRACGQYAAGEAKPAECTG
jgi:hypothetical protein